MKRKHTSILLLTMGIAIISVSAVSTFATPKKLPGSRISKTVHFRQGPGDSNPVSVGDAGTTQNGQYAVTGNANGVVTVTNIATNNVVRTLPMDAGVPVRQVFLSNDGLTVGAAQKDHTLFWNIATGNIVASVAEEVYAFSHDGSKFLSYSNGGVFLTSYPAMQHIFMLNNNGSGPEQWNFSPDDRYLALSLSTARPSADTQYPEPNRTYHDMPNTVLYDLTTGGRMVAYQPLWLNVLGSFTANSQAYYVTDGLLLNPSDSDIEGNYNLDLTTGQITQF